MNFLKPGILLSVWITLTVSTQGFAQNHTRTSFTKEELLSTAFMWLADKDSVDELHIYKLSCPSCILELKGAFDQDPKNLGAINFSTLKKEDRPVFLIGDFNARPGGDVHRIFVGDGESDNPLLLKDSAPQGQEIDWVLYKGNVEALRYEKVDYNVNGVYPSDHKPIVVDFQLIENIPE